MPLEALLTRLEVTSRGELLVSFRDKEIGSLGSLYVPDWKHVFPTKILGRKYGNIPENKKIISKLRNKIKKNPKLAGFQTRLKDNFWLIYQLFCSPNLKKELPKEFIKGNYTQQARWRLTNPGNLVELDDIIINALQKKKNIEKNIFNLKQESRSRAYSTRTINDLDELFDRNPDLNLDELTEQTKTISSLREIDSDFLKKRKNNLMRI